MKVFKTILKFVAVLVVLWLLGMLQGDGFY
jgi:hypothetical protein